MTKQVSLRKEIFDIIKALESYKGVSIDYQNRETDCEHGTPKTFTVVNSYQQVPDFKFSYDKKQEHYLVYLMTVQGTKETKKQTSSRSSITVKTIEDALLFVGSIYTTFVLLRSNNKSESYKN